MVMEMDKVCGTCRYGVEVEETWLDFNSLECAFDGGGCGDVWRTTCSRWEQV